jgi:hypothetical protein
MGLREFKKEFDVEFKKDIRALKKPMRGHVLPQHYPHIQVLKRDKKIILKVPKAWKEETKWWTGPVKYKWKGEPKLLKEDPTTRREYLERAGMIAGGLVPLLAMGTTPASQTGPGPLIYVGGMTGAAAGGKVEEFIEKHESDYRKIARKERQLIKKLKKKVEKRFEVR